jgi:4-hydroxybenzoate polyprenyltransferase
MTDLPPRSRVPALVRILRPTQWLKNFFLFAPLIFSRHLFNAEFFKQELAGFIAFCFVSSAVYILNDVTDRESDRRHPTKRFRPIASGEVPVWLGLAVSVILLGVALPASWRLGGGFFACAVVYLLVNIAYSFGLKRVMLVDVFVIAAGFMIRVVAGALAIAVQISPWLVLCTLFVSVFLAASKRRGEILLTTAAHAESGRSVLREYTLDFIDQVMTVAAAGMAISYALYTVSERTVSMFGTENLIFTTVFVLFGIFRYLHLVRTHGTDDNPTHMLTTDAPLLFNVLAWFVACVMIIYFNDLRSWVH